jgi:hypothetical protein
MNVRTIGVTGTRRGMTTAQFQTIHEILLDLPNTVVEMHHGDCIGVDAEFSLLVQELLPLVKIVSHPCDLKTRAHTEADETRSIKPALIRNKDIVNESDIMFGFPRGNKEELRSGTWAAIRYTRKVKKPLVIIWPDGSTE